MSSSRFNHNGDSRFPPRERSPPRFDQRRGSGQFGPPPAGRAATSYRPGDQQGFSAPPRDAPRAPKAAQEGAPRGGYPPRGRGFGRGGTPEAYGRRGRDEWSTEGSYARARSRSPKFGAPLSANSAGSESGRTENTFGGFRPDIRGPDNFRGSDIYRGPDRGRGRDFDRPRGRGLLPDERDPYARSGSRDRGRDRDFDSERYRRDVPGRPESRNSGGSQTTPSTPLTANATLGQLNNERMRESSKQPTPSDETSRRQSFASSHDPRSDIRANLTRPEPQIHSQSPTSPPSATSTLPFAHRQPKDESKNPDPTLVAPRGPKAELQIPTGPRASAAYAKRATGPVTPGQRHDVHESAAQSPSVARFAAQRTQSGAMFSAPSQPRGFAPRTSPTFRPSSQDGSIADPLHPKSIPTGPRAQQPSIRASMARPEPVIRRTSTQPKQPSIMKPMIPTKRDAGGDERAIRDRRDSAGSGGQEPRRASASILNRDGGAVRRGSDLMDMDGPEDSAGGQESEEDNLDEEDFEEAEKMFNKDLENLKAKRPPSPGHHPELMLLLEELNALEAAAEDLKNGVLPPPEIPEETSRPLGLPSPSSERLEAATDDAAKLDDASISEELPIDNLPFLVSGPPTPISQISFSKEELDAGDAPKFVINLLLREQVDEEAEWKENREILLSGYREWRLFGEHLKEQKRRAEEFRTAVSPVPTEPAKEAPATTGRRRDRSAFSTQAEEQEAIEASKESYEREKREREEREMAAVAEKEELPDYTREAEIPGMLGKSDRRADIFEDVNHLIDAGHVLKVFTFSLQPDDFTAEEQEKFIDAYVATPKKWGHIAAEIEGRDYQDCIRHYYMTKKETQYKIIAERRRAKRGRGKRMAGRPKASALLPDRPDAPGPDELTDAGRPKRAAAPAYFGEPKRDITETAKTPGRKTVKDEADKPAGRGGRGGRGGARKEGAGRGRGGKATATPTTAEPKALAPTAPLLAPNPSPQKPERRSKSTERKEERTRDLEVAQSLANLGVLPGQTVMQAGHTENWRTEPRAPTIVTAPPELRGVSAQDPEKPAPPRPAGQGRGPGQVTSYCVLTTKSHTMCRNNFQRQVTGGKEPEWESLANEANERIRREGHPGPPPMTAVTQQRRRVDSGPAPGPAPAAQRPLAPHEHDIEKEALASETPVYNLAAGRNQAEVVRPADARRPAVPVAAAASSYPDRPDPVMVSDSKDERQPMDQEHFTNLVAAHHAQTREAQRPFASDRPDQPMSYRLGVSQQPVLQPAAVQRSSAADLERSSRTQIQPKPEAIELRREPSYGDRYRQPPSMARAGTNGTPPQVEGRPSSMGQGSPANGPPHAPPGLAPAPVAPAEKKRSNIMMMLNDEPSEPEPSKPVQVPQPQSHAQSHTHQLQAQSAHAHSPHAQVAHVQAAHAQTAHAQSQMQDSRLQPNVSSTPYQSSPYARRDMPLEAARHEPQPQRPQHRYAESYGGVQMQQQSSLERRDWASSVQPQRSSFYERPSFTPVVAVASPPAQKSYLPQSRGVQIGRDPRERMEARDPRDVRMETRMDTRDPRDPRMETRLDPRDPRDSSTRMEQPLAARMDSPPPASHHHSRASSYASTHPGQPPGHTLAPHPYASIAPPSTAHGQGDARGAGGLGGGSLGGSASMGGAPLGGGGSLGGGSSMNNASLGGVQHSNAQHSAMAAPLQQSPYQRHAPIQPPPHQVHVQQQPPPPYSGQPAIQGVQHVQAPPRPASTFGMIDRGMDRGVDRGMERGIERQQMPHSDLLRREEPDRRYGSPALRAGFGGYAPPPPPPQTQHQQQTQQQQYPPGGREAYERRYDERR